jgi:hypothetical protein
MDGQREGYTSLHSLSWLPESSVPANRAQDRKMLAHAGGMRHLLRLAPGAQPLVGRLGFRPRKYCAECSPPSGRPSEDSKVLYRISGHSPGARERARGGMRINLTLS